MGFSKICQLERKQEMTEQEKYMKAAIKQAKKAYEEEVITVEIRIKIRWHMQRSQRSTGQAKNLVTGGLRAARCM